MINIAVLGYGTVGSGVVELLDINKEIIKKRTKEEINVKYILDIKEFKSDKYENKIIDNIDKILNDKEVSIVAEVIGGATIAYQYTKMLLEAGKSVVTSNKELVATKGVELLKIAQENNVKYLFEASVGGGIPVIQPMIESLVTNNIDEIIGIMNGTTNYILTKMKKENISFEVALKQAQELGYAESNPYADIKGYDVCRKICILSSLAYGVNINPDKVNVKGIQEIKLDDLIEAEKKRYVIKLIGYSKLKNKDTVEIFVSPCVIEKNHPLANVEDVYNAILVNGDMTGNVMFYGKGAGKFPTASAVCADIINCIDNKKKIEFEWKEKEINIEEPKLKLLEKLNLPIIE